MKKLVVTVWFLAASTLWAVPETRTILVFPFENQSSNADLGWISEAFAQVLSSRLAAPNRYVLDRDERIAAYEQLGIPPGTPVTLATAYKVAQTLGVNWAVVGSFKVEGDRLTAQCQLLRMNPAKLTQPLEATGALADLIDLQTQLAWRLLATYDPDYTVGTEEDFARLFAQIRLDAFENYIRGILAPDEQSRVHFLTEANRLNPSDHRAAFELGRYYFDEKDYTNSAVWLAKLADGDPNYLESLFFLGVDDYFAGQYQKAEQDFSALEQRIPLNEVASNLGVMESRRDEYAEALTNIERAYKGDPSDADFCFNLGACFWYLKQYPQARQYVEAAVKANEDDPEAHTLLALVCQKLGDVEGQRRELQWLAAHESGWSGELQADFSPQLRVKKRYNGHAFRLLALTVHNVEEATLSAEPPAVHGQFHLDRGRKLLADGRLTEAQRDLTEAVSLLPSSSEAHLVLGQVYEAEGKHEDAARELEASLRLDNNAMTQLWLARVYLSLHQPDVALEHGRAALVLDPGNHDAAQLVAAIQKRVAAGTKTSD